MKTIFHLASLFLLFAGCAPSTQEEFQSEGEVLCRSLRADLQKIHSKEDARKLYPSIKKKYSKIARLMVSAGSLYEQDTREPCQENLNGAPSQELFRELGRLYGIPGVREILEKAQEEALEN